MNVLRKVKTWTRALWARTSPLVPRPSASLPPGLDRIIRPEASMRWLVPSVASVTPAYIELILRGAVAGNQLQQWELFDLMEDTWPRLSKNLNEVKRAVQSREWKIKPWADEDEPPTPEAEEKSNFVADAIWNMRPAPDSDENAYLGTIYDILDAWSKGTSVLEIEWEAADGGIVPRATSWVHPMYYGWSQEGYIGLQVGNLDAGSSGTGILPVSRVFTSRSTIERFPENKFLIAINRAKSGHPLSGALLRPLAFWWCAANFSAEWLLNFAQIFGLPIRWANYATGSSNELVNQICAMLENMGSAGWAAFPAGTTIDLKEASKNGQDNPQSGVLDRADRQCDLIVLGQTLTTDVGQGGSGSRALGQVHEGVRSEVIQAAATFAENVINTQLIPAILRLNYGDDSDAPEMCAEEEKIEDVKANAERDAILMPFIPMPKTWFYKRHDIPLPQPGEETIGGTPETHLIEHEKLDTPLPARAMSMAMDKNFSVGDRVKVRPGKEHDQMTKGKTGTVVEMSTCALAVLFDGMDSIHKWYIAEELQAIERNGSRMSAAAARSPLAPRPSHLEDILKSRAVHLQPLLDQVNKLAKIQDPVELSEAIGELQRALPTIGDELHADKTLMRAIETALSDSMSNALVDELHKKGTML
jgi:phage gp29-like protein